MKTEWLLAAIVMISALLPLARKLRRGQKWIRGAAVFTLALTAVGAVFYIATAQKQSRSLQQLLASVPREGRPGGYVSSDRCEACHPSQYTSWHNTFHRTMTQFAKPETVVGNFNNVTLELLGETYRLQRRGDEFWAEMPDPDWKNDPRNAGLKNPPPAPRVEKRIGMLTGLHHMQVCWVPGRAGNTQVIFPFAWLPEDQRWVPFHSTFLRDPAMPPTRHVWNVNCINCHSVGGQPRPDMQSQILDTQVGEFGIACEACHGPAEPHVRANRDPLRRYQYRQSRQPDPTIVNPERQPPGRSSQICGQCHGIKWISNREDWSQNGFRYRPGEELDATTPIFRPRRLNTTQNWLKEPLKKNPRFVEEHYWPDGIVRVSGREYNGLVESPCHERGGLSCLSCHSLHKSQPDDQLAARMETNEACFQCHKDFRDKLQQHTRHPPASGGSLCYNCHMPHTTYGLLKAIRSHFIDSPNVQTNLLTGRPNACNLCHLDQSLGWTAQHLSEWYGKPKAELSEEQQTISAAVLWLLRGDAGLRALTAWSLGWESARQASGERWLAPYLGQLLEDPYSAVRYIAQRSLRRLPGYQDLVYDFVGPAETRAQARQRVLGLWRNASARPLDRTGPQILIETNGALQQETFDRLLRQRDDRALDLQE